LLFAGAEQAAYYSVDDGAHWKSLRLNMPATAIRDLIVKDNDVAVATHGRGFWILDDISALRQAAFDGAPKTTLFRPSVAWRFRSNRWPDTPLPLDEPTAPNPPEGAIIDYSLDANASGPVTIDIFDMTGALVRRYASTDSIEPMVPNTNVPTWWVRPQQLVMTTAGVHRLAWDLHYPYPKGVEFEYPISAAPHDTPKEPRGPWVLPGTYSVRLTVNGKTFTQPLVVKIDPRIPTSAAGLALQFSLSKQLYDAMNRDPKKAAALQPLYSQLQSSDAAPSTQLVRAVRAALK
jgi:hypothetical protein